MVKEVVYLGIATKYNEKVKKKSKRGNNKIDYLGYI